MATHAQRERLQTEIAKLRPEIERLAGEAEHLAKTKHLIRAVCRDGLTEGHLSEVYAALDLLTKASAFRDMKPGLLRIRKLAASLIQTPDM